MHGHLRILDSSQFLCPQNRTRMYTVGVNAMHTRELPREPRLLSAGPAPTFLNILHPSIEPLQEHTLSAHLKVNLLMYKHILQEHRVSLACVSLDRDPRAEFGPYFRTDGLIPTLRTANHPCPGIISDRYLSFQVFLNTGASWYAMSSVHCHVAEIHVSSFFGHHRF